MAGITPHESDQSAAITASSPDVMTLLDKVRELREAMNKTPVNAGGTGEVATGGRSGIDVSNDLEKDINIDAPINNNAACAITHNSNIRITYYNFESDDGEAAVSRGGMKAYRVWLPGAYLAALQTLRITLGIGRNELARMAYTDLLRRFGMDVEWPEKAEQKTSSR